MVKPHKDQLPLKYLGVELVFDGPIGQTVNPCTEARWRMSTDQYRCLKCGVVWDVDEPRPPCQEKQP